MDRINKMCQRKGVDRRKFLRVTGATAGAIGLSDMLGGQTRGAEQLGALPVYPVGGPNSAELALCIDHDIWDQDPNKSRLGYGELSPAQRAAYTEKMVDAASAVHPEFFPEGDKAVEAAAFVPAGFDSNTTDAAPAAFADPSAAAGNSITVDPAEGAMDPRKKWEPGQILEVRFISAPSKTIRGRIEKYVIEGWEANCNIKFRFNSTQNAADIRVSAFKGGGSWSYVGTDSKTISSSKETMHFGWLEDNLPEDEFRSVVLHEFGHALGLIHEHQHPTGAINWNRAKVIQYYSGPPNNWSIDKIERNVLQRYDGNIITDAFRTSFDKFSIMLYPTSALHTLDGFSSGWNTNLSVSDTELAARVYGPARGGGGGGITTPTPNVRRANLPVGNAGLVGEEIKSPGDAVLYKVEIATAGSYRIETFEDSPSITMKLSLFSSDDLTKQPVAMNHHGGERLLNARISDNSGKGTYDLAKGTHFVLAEHFFKTGSSVGKFNIRVHQP